MLVVFAASGQEVYFSRTVSKHLAVQTASVLHFLFENGIEAIILILRTKFCKM